MLLSQRLPGSLLFVGSEGIGKKLFALELAKALTADLEVPAEAEIVIEVANAIVNCANTIAPAIKGRAVLVGEPSSLSPPMSSPNTSKTFALAK